MANNEQNGPVPNTTQSQTVVVTGLTNREFLERYARPGRVGLSGGITLIDKAIVRAQRHVDKAANGVCGRTRFCSRARVTTGTIG